jgi:transcriptional regulator with XRE-family HTH domain
VNNTAAIKAFGIHLRVLREKAGLSQQGLADAAGVAKITVQRVENAKSSASLDLLVTLADALDISLKKLVDF